ncbi:MULTISPECIES: acyl-CoA thioesterase [Eubacteriales]|uniref:Uncharacterized protein n=1 Tax=Ruminiclostridium papyrosolvens C7 TaxID=1330534 RepID=U4R3C5_9FIRM|nr:MULTISPECIES: acyl-CoA thioesterase [Eubacteriales]AEY67073.1 putative thioesterase [Clostridium sp. BNL1100]EPR12224.1 hypothetical protein L323_09250 [Ruminiclostridium papyrosolvens C7]
MSKEFNKNELVETEIKVRLVECDPYEIAHNSSYFVWFEMGRFDYAEANGYKLTSMAADEETVYITLHTKCKYIKSCRFKDELVVKTRITKPPFIFAKYNFEQKLYNKNTGELIAKCWTENAAVSKSKKCVLRVSEDNALVSLK